MKNQKKRVIISAYAFFAILGVLLISLSMQSMFISYPEVKSVLLELGVEILGAVIIFIGLDKFFLRGELSLVEEIKDIVSHFKQPAHHLLRVTQRDSNDIKRRIKDSTEVCLLAHTSKDFLEYFRSDLSNLLERGGKLRVIAVDPDSSGGKSIMESSDIGNYENDISTSLKLLQQFKHDEAKLKLLSYNPACAIIIMHQKRTHEPFVQVGFYAPHYKSDPEARLLISFKGWTLKEWRDTYINQFELLWNDGHDPK